MKTDRRIKPTPRLRAMEMPTALVRWDLALMGMLAVLGLLTRPGPR